MTPDEVLQFIHDNDIAIVDLKFNDLPGTWQHFSIPSSELTELADLTGSIFEDGIGFDGSAVSGFDKIQESDMLLIPDPTTAILDPITQIPTLSMVCDIHDPETRQPYTRDPRYIAAKAEAYLAGSGIADVSYWGPEMEFFIFDDVRFGQSINAAWASVDSIEGEWNTDRDERPNLGYKQRSKEGLFPVPPHDQYQDLRSEMTLALEKAGVRVDVHHHEVATGGQSEIDLKYDSLLRMGDKVMLAKYVVRNLARRAGKVVTFMPKPLLAANGSGFHTHQSLFRGGDNLFYGADDPGGLSDLCRWYIGGLLAHAPALTALCAPTTNSYRRLVPGSNAPMHLVYSTRERAAAVRIPRYSSQPAARRVEFRPADPTCNPYVAFAAMLMAGLDGIERRLEPGDAYQGSLARLSRAERLALPMVPGFLQEALGSLEADHAFLRAGGVFTQDVIDTWLEYKWAEVDDLRSRPHPWEFHVSFDA